MIPNERKTRRRAYGLFIGAALICFFALAWATGRGVGLQPDSAFYLDCAKHIRAGDGYATSVQDYLKPISLGRYLEEMNAQGHVQPRPEVVFPPLYSFAIAALGGTGLDVQPASRCLGLILFAFNILLAGVFVYRYTAPRRSPALAAAALMFGSESMMMLHANALSEPLFIFLGVLGLMGLTSHIENGKLLSLFCGSAAIGLAFLTRYAGGALVVAGALGLFLLQKRPLRRRLWVLAAFLTVSCLPVALFIVRNVIVAGDPTNRLPSLFVNPTRGLISTLMTTFSSWVFPNLHKVLEIQVHKDVLAIVSLILLTAIGVAAVVLMRKAQRSAAGPSAALPRTPALLATFLPVYFAYILFSAFFIDPEIPLDYRMLSPFFVVGLIAGLAVLGRIGSGLKTGRLRTVLTAAAILYLVGYSAIGAAWLIRFQARGGGYNNEEWRSPEMESAFARISAEPPGTPILTNDNSAVYFLGGRDSYFVPLARKLARLDELKAEIGTGPVLLFYFKTKMHVVRDEADAGLSSDRIEQALAEGLAAEVLVRRPTVTLFRMNTP
jgi:hypothetical protein